MDMATTRFPLKHTAPTKTKTLLHHHMWRNAVKHDVATLRWRTKALRHLARLAERSPDILSLDLNNPDSIHDTAWLPVADSIELRMELTPPIRDNDSLSLPQPDDLEAAPGPNLHTDLRSCSKAIRFVTRRLINISAINGNATQLWQGSPPNFRKKTRVALQSIFRTATRIPDSQVIPTDLSTIRDDTSGRLIRTPANVIAQVENLATKALSPDPILPPGSISVAIKSHPDIFRPHPHGRGLYHP
jgi:hypothetical protein